MIFSDYSPPPSPNIDEQNDALKKGLGRAHEWALAGRLNESSLLHACLNDLRFDLDVESTRGNWLWQIIQTANLVDRFREPILEALANPPQGNDAEQLAELAVHYALAGDNRFRTRLYEFVEQKQYPERPWLAEEQIAALDGEAGFLFAIQIRVNRLADREPEWDDFHLIDQAVVRFGEARVVELLNSSTGAKRLCECWLLHRNEKDANPKGSHRERMQAITIGYIIAAAESDECRYGKFRGWGMYATITDLENVLNRLGEATNPSIIANYLKVFSNRPLPYCDPRVIALCEHANEEVRRRAFGALEMNSHSMIRELALAELKKGVRDGSVVALFIRNYAANDESKILQALELPSDECKLHWLLMDITKVFEVNNNADASQLAVIAYALTPCSNCRLHAARLLFKQQSAPSWLSKECRYDSVSELQELDGRLKLNQSQPNVDIPGL